MPEEAAHSFYFNNNTNSQCFSSGAVVFACVLDERVCLLGRTMNEDL